MNDLQLNELSEINKIVEDGINNKYLGKNVKSSITGEIFYISDKGAIKNFPTSEPYLYSNTAGKNGCPANYINVNEDLNSSNFLEENPTFFMSSPMVYVGDFQGQSCGAGKNVFVDQLPTLETSSVGCFTSNSGVLLGSEKTFDQCKSLASLEGYPMFSLNTSETDNATLYYGNNGTVTGDVYCEGGWGNADYAVKKNMDCLYGINSLGDKISCSTGGVLNENNGFYCVPKNNELKAGLVGNCYGFNNTDGSTSYTKTPFNLLSIELPLDSCTYVDEQWRYNISGIKSLIISPDGVYQLINQSGDTLISWTSPLSNTQCSYGGGVNLSTLTATYGGSCTSQCSITPGNYTSNVVKLINNNSTSTAGTTANYQNLENPSFNIGSAWDEYYGTGDLSNTIGAGVDPCPGCSKDFTITYQCGNSTPVTTNVAASAEGTLISLPCETTYTSCITAIGISDEGDVKILSDIYGTPQLLFSVCDTYKGKLLSIPDVLSTPAWVTMKNKITITFDNKEYSMIYGPGQINKGEYIISPSATCYLHVTDSLPIIVYFTEKLSCNTTNTNFTGIQTVGSTPTPESTNTEWCVNTRVQHGVIPYRTWGTLSDQSARAKWNSINCNDLSNKTLPPPATSVFAINQFTTPTYMNNYGKLGYVDDEMVLHEYSQELTPTFIETPDSTISSGTVLETMNYTTINQCKVECIKNDCNWISANGTTCTLYSDSNGITSSTGGTVYEKISPSESPSSTCPFQDMQSISTSTWENFVKSETPMTSQTSCYEKHDNFLNQEIALTGGLITNIKNELVAQNEETTNYLKNHQNNVGAIMADIRNMKTINSEGFTDLATTKKMYDETLDLETNSSNQIMLWTFITITLITMNYLLIFNPSSNYSLGIAWIIIVVILLIVGRIIPIVLKNTNFHL